MTPTRALLLVNDLRANGGAEVALGTLARHLGHAGVDVWVAGLYAGGPLVERMGLPPDRILVLGASRRLPIDPAAVVRLARFLRRHRIQVIHTHLFESSFAGRLAAELARTPVRITTEHNVYLRKPAWCVRVDRALARRTTLLTAVSDAVGAHAARQLGLAPDALVTVQNPVDFGRIPVLSKAEVRKKREELGVAEDAPLLLAVGRMVEQKGYPDLLEAMAGIVKSEPRSTLLVVGRGPLEAAMRSRAAELSLAERVRFLGFREDLFALMRAADLLVMASAWEGLPVTIVEAQGCGLPVVATDVGGVREVVEDGVTGHLVPAGRPDALRDAVLRALADRSGLRAMGALARERAEQKFAAPAVARAVAATYERLLKEVGAA